MSSNARLGVTSRSSPARPARRFGGTAHSPSPRNWGGKADTSMESRWAHVGPVHQVLAFAVAVMVAY